MDNKIAVKFDAEKPQFGLISSKFLLLLARVLTFGAKKYAAHNWRKGMVTSRYYDALQRHLTAWNDGEDLDPESGISHLGHAVCCLMFLAETVEVQPNLDDRYKPDVAKTRDPLSSGKGNPLSEDAQKHSELPHPADWNFRNPGLSPLCVEPVRRPRAEEFVGQAFSASDIQSQSYPFPR